MAAPALEMRGKMRRESGEPQPETPLNTARDEARPRPISPQCSSVCCWLSTSYKDFHPDGEVARREGNRRPCAVSYPASGAPPSVMKALTRVSITWIGLRYAGICATKRLPVSCGIGDELSSARRHWPLPC